MNILRTTALVALLSLAACADDAPETGVDSQAVCDCPAATAAATSYDNTGSGLADGHVQGALDELAARAEGSPDAWSRITLEMAKTTNGSSATDYSMTVACPGVAPDVARAMGGSCESNSNAVTLQGTALQDTGFTCIWNKPEGQAIEFTAKVTCLAKAP